MSGSPDASGEPPRRRSGLPGWRFVLAIVVCAVVLSAIVRATLVDVYYIPSGSMEPLLETGDRVLVSRTDYRFGEIRRGGLVVFDGRGSFAPFNSGNSPFVDLLQQAGQWLGVAGSDTIYVKRVIGLPGDTVECCGPDGRLQINGEPVQEDYIFDGDAPSNMEFSVQVPKDRLWLMGDHRSASADSRALLGAPGGGMVPVERVIGRPLSIIWPLDRAAGLDRIQLGSQPADQPAEN
ncbi:signal peptidase I [Arthrobacter sp.]|uniref:signal peptidase I n=1 Tax=Arthrobacter sp. TaxID=1667 RepID=UPI00339A07FF